MLQRLRGRTPQSGARRGGEAATRRGCLSLRRRLRPPSVRQGTCREEILGLRGHRVLMDALLSARDTRTWRRDAVPRPQPGSRPGPGPLPAPAQPKHGEARARAKLLQCRGSVTAFMVSVQKKINKAPAGVLKQGFVSVLSEFTSCGQAVVTQGAILTGTRLPRSRWAQNAASTLHGRGLLPSSQKWLKPTVPLLLTLLARGVLRKSPAIPYRLLSLCNTRQECQSLDHVILT